MIFGVFTKLILYVLVCTIMLFLYVQVMHNSVERYKIVPDETCPEGELFLTSLPSGACCCDPNLSISMKNITTHVLRDTSSESSCSDRASMRGPGQRVVSYSLYGEFGGDYYQGMVEQISRVKEVYPGWVIRIYTNPSNRSLEWLCSLACQHPHVDICDVNDIPGLGDVSQSVGTLWRDIVIGDPLVKKYVIRDSDSPIIQRELDAVKEWFRSGKCFHVMRDHRAHIMHIMGGMWGGCNTSYRLSVLQKIRMKLLENTKNIKRDQQALKKYLWPKLSKNSLMHDSYHCKTFKGSQPFPTQRNNYTFVGMRLYRTKYKLHRIKDTCPVECRPKEHTDWEYC